jgi:mono/diheme cytochrome c family protein
MNTQLILTAWLLLAVFAAPAAETRLTLPPETAKLKPGEGAELATAQCLLCHSADYIATQPRLVRPAWKASVQKMQQKYGAPIPADKVEALVDYLTRNYGAEGATNAPPAVKPPPKR